MSANDYYAGGKPQGQYGQSHQGQYYPPAGAYDTLMSNLNTVPGGSQRDLLLNADTDGML